MKALKDDGKLSFQQYMEEMPQAETVPRMYGLPKFHKNPRDPPYRPIVDYTGSCTYKVAKPMSNIINPLIAKSKHHLLNSKALGEKIKDLQLDSDNIWISHDVVALFPCIPVKESLDMIETRLNNDPTPHK